MNIVVFTGAGVSKESGIDTFRDNDGLWENYNVEDIATLDAWKWNKEDMLRFYNERKNQLSTVEPNKAHKLIADLEKANNVTVITQNVDDLHERAGSTNVLHLHGELTKCQSSKDSTLTYPYDKDLKIGDKCDKGSQLRPHVVWFGENPNNIPESITAIRDCDALIIIGTSLQITYTLSLLENIDEEKAVMIYIDPNPSKDLDDIMPIEYIKENATTGMEKVFNWMN